LTGERQPLLWHSIAYSERNSFAEPFAADSASTCVDNLFGCTNVEIALHDHSATLTYRYQSGAPARQFFDKAGQCVPVEHVIEIPESCWASIEYNGRYSCIDTGAWWYEHVVVNVAVGGFVSPNVFMSTKPIEHYAQLARLR